MITLDQARVALKKVADLHRNRNNFLFAVVDKCTEGYKVLVFMNGPQGKDDILYFSVDDVWIIYRHVPGLTKEDIHVF